MQELKPGTLLRGGKYKIEATLGQGGFGITYKAMMKTTIGGDIGQMSIDVPVAIKEFFMKESCQRDESTSQVSIPTEGSKDIVLAFRRKFVKEAHNIANMNHPNIVKVTDVFEENGTVYYVMQYLPGGSLSSYVRKQGDAFTTADALRMTMQIGSALQYMHEERHTCHLDVKPGNILLDDNGNAVLIDFGLAKNYDDAGQQTSSTPVGISKGYAPLEQYQQSLKEFSPQTDVYSLGATLYFMLLRKAPPEASVINEEGLPPCPENIDPSIWRVIEKAMQPRRRDRYQTVKEMTNDLLSRDDETSFSTTVSGRETPEGHAAPQKPEPVKRQEAPQKPEPVKKPETPLKPKKKGKTPVIVAVVAAVVILAVVAVVMLSRGGGDTAGSQNAAAVSASTDNGGAEGGGTVQDKQILDPNGNLSYTYTGAFDGNVPAGKGKAVYPKDDKDGRVSYEGNFTKGQRDGQGRLVYANGDYFEGEFDMGHFKKGKYHVAEDGSHFEGTFKDDKPWDGIWYNESNRFVSRTTEGRDITIN